MEYFLIKIQDYQDVHNHARSKGFTAGKSLKTLDNIVIF